LCKPFEHRSSFARVRGRLPAASGLLFPSILSFGNVEFHFGSNEVTVATLRSCFVVREALILDNL